MKKRSKTSEEMDQKIFNALNRLGIQETRELIIKFIEGGGFKLNEDEGLILSAFLSYHNRSGEENDLLIISNFINFALYQGTKQSN